MQACTQWTHSDIWSQLATMPQCLFEIGDRQSEKKRWNGDQRAICDAPHGLDARRGVIRHRGVSDGSDGARPLSRSHSARTDMFFADATPSFTAPLRKWYGNLAFNPTFSSLGNPRNCSLHVPHAPIPIRGISASRGCVVKKLSKYTLKESFRCLWRKRLI